MVSHGCLLYVYVNWLYMDENFVGIQTCAEAEHWINQLHHGYQLQNKQSLEYTKTKMEQ